jgi:CheY-like chemotaxis protein
VAHDFNNMLGAILGAAEIIRSENALDPEYDRYLEIIQQAASHTADLTSKLLTFGRKGKVISTAVDMHAILGDTVALLERSIDKRIRILVQPQALNHAIAGDNAQLQNALLNIGINASHAMPEGGELRFITANTTLEATYCDASPFRIAPGEYLEVEIRDTGCGIPIEHIAKIFDPFFTTKEQGKGTGLGLAAVYGTVLDHHGAITVYSEVGRGTIFHIYLPVSEDLAPIARPSDETIPGTGLILLADDEEIMRVVAAKMLRSLHYDVLTADDGAEAVRVYQERHAEIDLVILDMIMPEMSGRDAFERIRAIEPACKVIISSGFSRSDDLDTMKASGLAGFIRKPFRISELSRVVSKALGGPVSGAATSE